MVLAASAPHCSPASSQRLGKRRPEGGPRSLPSARASHQVWALFRQDNSLVSFLSTVFNGTEYVDATRKCPRDTSFNAAFAQIPFEVNVPCLQWPKPFVQRHVLPTPQFIDAYNYGINGVDVADQYCVRFKTSQPSSRIWLCLFFWLLDATIVNSYLLGKQHFEASMSQNERQRITPPANGHKEFRHHLVKSLARGEEKRLHITKATKHRGPIRNPQASIAGGISFAALVDGLKVWLISWIALYVLEYCSYRLRHLVYSSSHCWWLCIYLYIHNRLGLETGKLFWLG